MTVLGWFISCRISGKYVALAVKMKGELLVRSSPFSCSIWELFLFEMAPELIAERGEELVGEVRISSRGESLIE